MDTVKEIFESLKNYLSDRLTNPIYGGFVVSWVIINFRLVLVLLAGDGTWRDKIDYIDTRLFPHWSDWAAYGYVLPLIAAILYTLISPVLTRYVTVYLRRQERVTMHRLLIEANETPLAKPAADELRRAIFQERENRLAQEQKDQSRITELTSQVDVLIAENRILKGKPTEVESEINLTDPQDITENVLEGALPNNFAYPLKFNDFMQVKDIAVAKLIRTGVSRRLANVLYANREGKSFDAGDVQRITSLGLYDAIKILEELEKLYLIYSSSNSQGNARYTISDAGRQALEAILLRGFQPT